MTRLPSSDSSGRQPNPAAEPPSLGCADLAAVALLVGCVVVLFWKVVFTPAMFFYRDVFNYSYPHARFIHEALGHGYLPYWNPILNYGEPVLANPNFLVFYPSTLFLALLPVDFAYSMHYVAHIALAGVGTYWLARRWRQSRSAAFFAALVFAFSGPVLSLGNFYNHVAAAAWIPWALLMTDRALESRSRRPWILLTLVFALQFLAAEPFTLIATFGLSVACAFYRTGNPRRLLGEENRRILAAFVVVGLLMLALSAVQFLPSLDLLEHARRGTEGLPFNETTSWSFHPLGLLEFVLPGFFGSPFDGPSLWTLVLNCRNMPYFPSFFVGFVPIFFALAGWALGQDRRRVFAAGSALLLILLSFGRFTPLFALAYLLIPPLALVRFPVKLLVPALLFLALLGGWGFDALRRPGNEISERGRRLQLPLLTLLACVLLVWIVSFLAPAWITGPAEWVLLRTNQMFMRNAAGALTPAMVSGAKAFLLKMLQWQLPGLAGFALGGALWTVGLQRGAVWARRAFPPVIILGLVQMVAVNYSANPTVPRSFYAYRPPVLDHFQASAQPYRFAYVFREATKASDLPQPQAFLNLQSVPGASDLSPTAQRAFRDRLILARGSMLEGVEGVANIDVERSFPPFLYDFWHFVRSLDADEARTACLLGRTNVKYQILSGRETNSVTREVAPIFNGSPKPSYLYENLCTVPRAYVAESVLKSSDPAQILTKLSEPTFDAEKQVFLADEARAVALTEGWGSLGRVEITERRPNLVRLRTQLSRPGYVLLLDRFDPNWHATLDGREVRVSRANLLFRAVYAEAGTHEIRFYYRQRGLAAGTAISLVALAILAGLYALDRRRNPLV
jgi:hypothetical protein